MFPKVSINSSENALVINLDQARLEDIVEKKLNYFLKQNPLLDKNILDHFYRPAEQALVETCLVKYNGTQVKVAQLLGINRNTLKKKIILYNINIKNLLLKEKNSYPKSKTFLSSLASLDLLVACRAKLALIDFKTQALEGELLKTFCLPVEQKIIQRLLEYCRGNQIRASQKLGINRNTLKKKVQAFARIRNWL